MKQNFIAKDKEKRLSIDERHAMLQPPGTSKINKLLY